MMTRRDMSHRFFALLLRKAILLSGLLLSSQAMAVYLDSMIHEVPPEKRFIATEISNNTGISNLYTLTAYKIERPGGRNERVSTTESKEILYTPLKSVINAGSSEYFKIFYRGPEDNVERYYRLIVKESPMGLFDIARNRSKIAVLPVTSISTFLIVRPAKMNFGYQVDEVKGTVKNTGNTFFRIIIQQGCDGKDEDSLQLNILPGETYRNPKVSPKNKKYIVFNGKYIRLGGGCFTTGDE